MITWVFLHRVDVFPCARRSAMIFFYFCMSEEIFENLKCHVGDFYGMAVRS